MRLDLATQPLGDSRLSVRGDKLGVSQKYSVKQSFVRSSAVFGDGLKLGLSQVNTYKFDIMGAEFTYNMGDNVGIQPPMHTTQFFNFTGNTDTSPKTYTSGTGRLSLMDTTPQKFSNLDYTQHTMPFAPPITNPKQPPLQVSYTVDNTISIQTRITNRYNKHLNNPAYLYATQDKNHIQHRHTHRTRHPIRSKICRSIWGIRTGKYRLHTGNKKQHTRQLVYAI